MIRESIGTEELAQGDLASATSTRFAMANIRVARRFAWVFTVHWAIVALSSGGLLQLVAPSGWPSRSGFATLLALASGFLARRLRRPSLRWRDERATVALVVALLFAQQVFMTAFSWQHELMMPALIVPPLLALFFQFVPATRVALHASWFGLGLMSALAGVAFGASSDLLGSIPAALAVHVVAATAGLLRSRSYRRGIAEAWEASFEVHEDRLRMQRELETARQIQLGMLPREGPSLPWVDWAALSLPASEVGGDYYEHRVTPEGALVVTLADVAGHGLPSGLLLAGLRASLALLDNVEDPAEVFERLHHMVRRTRHEHAFVTLLQLRLDPNGERGEVVIAGHPPVLIARGDGRVDEIGASSTPLGAMKQLRIARLEIALKPRDVLLLTTDGVYETTSPEGETLGMDGLAAALGAAAREGSSAQEVRDGVLRRIWELKGEARQEDDLTMVVVGRR